MDVLKKENFEDIIAFSVSEPGAMGPQDMTFYRANGESFSIDYLEDETYEKLKELYPALRGCYWDGPMKNEIASSDTFVFVVGGRIDDRVTTIPDGMRHIYLDYGNHLVVKEEYYNAIMELLEGKSNCEATYQWTDYLDEAGFKEKIKEIRTT